MAGFAKVLGILCMVGALLVVVVGVIGFLAASRSNTTSDTADSIAVGFGLAYLIGSVATAILLATIGVTAYVVGDSAQRAEAERRRSWQAPAIQPASNPPFRY